MYVQAYLKRIGYRGTTKPSISVLRQLHRRHLLSVPFENLDIQSHIPIVLSEKAFQDKIIKHRRGGFCYELNGFFAGLLRELGFEVKMLSARVARKNGGYGGEFDHMTLLVQLDHPWLADVGFGDSFTEPKRLDTSSPQEDHGRAYRFRRKNSWIILSRKLEGTRQWEPQYKFTLKPRKLGDYASRCQWQQTSPWSHFTKGHLCSQLTREGRITLTETKLVETSGKKKIERTLKNPVEFSLLLQGRFGIRID